MKVQDVDMQPAQPMVSTSATRHPASNEKLSIINHTRGLLRGRWSDSQQLQDLYKQLEKLDQYAYATDVLLTKIKQDEKDGKPISLREHQALVKFIYKDHSLPSSFKFNNAIQRLNAYDDLRTTMNCETLGLAGAIYKYQWQYDHQSRNLKRSYYYYRRGFECWKRYLSLDEVTQKSNPHLCDDGYTAINFAYVEELMAMENLEEIGATIDISDVVRKGLAESDNTRNFIVHHFLEAFRSGALNIHDSHSWILATVAEAYFGLKRYDDALNFIRHYRERENDAWKVRTFSRQLLSLAYLQHMQLDWCNSAKQNPAISTKLDELSAQIEPRKINECLIAVLHDRSPNDKQSWVDVKREGRLGLALSGGGFRASLFHIGVLAALAERNKLKEVEVLSCVSGGSILGAYYYLKLRRLLESKADDEIQREDYINLIMEVVSEFMEGVQQNLRMRVLSNLVCNMRMIFDRGYSRTHRLGELYERYLYSKVFKKDNGENIFMSDIRILPKGEPDFNIAVDNWKRTNRVPKLILNATAVNTGHNWQFAATWMGEPPGSIQSDIDVKPRLRRMYYDDAPGNYKRFRLGYAVGASSCVPVMFPPIPLPDLYPGIELQLVDGGLHDNQGIVALIEQECINMIISDASGQMPTTIKAERNEISVFYRSDTVLQERLRELQFKDLKERKYTAQLSSLTTVHLKRDLHERPVSWKDCNDPPRAIFDDIADKSTADLTDYGILKSLQRKLSEIRTDLDSFHDTEAYALMYSGYAQTHYELDVKKEKQFQRNEEWKFLSVEDSLSGRAASGRMMRILSTSRKVPLKILDLYPMIKYATYGIVGMIGLVSLYWLYVNRDIDIPVPVSPIFWTLLVAVVGYLISKPLARILSISSVVRKKAFWVVAMTAMWVASNVYLWLLNPLYNKAGKIRK